MNLEQVTSVVEARGWDQVSTQTPSDAVLGGAAVG